MLQSQKVPTSKVNTPRGFLCVSTPEATAFDLVGYPEHCGGLDNVTTVLAELAEKMDGQKLGQLSQISPIPWAQRLGYLLDLVGSQATADPMAGIVLKAAREYVSLNSKRPLKSAARDRRWKLFVNEHVEPDL